MPTANMVANAPRSALLGHTGFVGSNLAAQHAFAHHYNSKNIGDAAGGEFDLIVCAAVSAVKWQANKDPAADWARIEALTGVLAAMRARRFILISTIDVYPDPRGVDESFDPSTLPNHAYGTHRLRLEAWVREKFSMHHVIRLPGLFGPGLKKNVIYDLLHDNCLDVINPRSSFQYYDLGRLWADVEKIATAALPLVNIATEPVATSEIMARFFPGKAVGSRAAAEAHYDYRTRHAALWGRGDGYQYSAAMVLDQMEKFIAGERAIKGQLNASKI